jgi:hypothetical protein
MVISVVVAEVAVGGGSVPVVEEQVAALAELAQTQSRVPVAL